MLNPRQVSTDESDAQSPKKIARGRKWDDDSSTDNDNKLSDYSASEGSQSDGSDNSDDENDNSFEAIDGFFNTLHITRHKFERYPHAQYISIHTPSLTHYVRATIPRLIGRTKYQHPRCRNWSRAKRGRKAKANFPSFVPR